ncbi:RibD family protein [Tianweitania sp. BSSL-BM11]|uniref:RibD family protein n=1 Tax=Tianweitania aestuarii TaxID=2814886 RepID=A0ABS5RXF6_9HYPH|nr:RibD family protein [Tianweitania aestuarii]MBS9721699.1 RibD family protein [Tianweitania aestuarii]
MKPHVICLMVTSIDGRLHASRWTQSPDGQKSDWSDAFETLHDKLGGDAWIVGRVTMAEMSKAQTHPPANAGPVERPHHFAKRDAKAYAIALDQSGKLHFNKPDVGGDHVVVLLGRDVPDSHLAELTADGVSYIVADGDTIDLSAALDVLGRELGIRRLLLEGGASINGSFLAAGLVNEISLLIAPAVDGNPERQAFVDAGPDGLAGKVKLSLTSCETLDHGVVHLRYAVS